ncbi:hypothetical protein SAMN05660297_02832 [Natronincola peptidivorans]|uniref:Uncharacterized protein n=1 Tax=Natronincola peptidivorans TaxID=426128 RepID=A0A1I0FKF5_9FIRM|nr:hypothetical protein [Natronincola peptidivorans]SET58557.1 hypothetical protein SAMN05660297_02832 [Natronincola peptidivorans]
MKTKTPITKGIAMILCMITVILSWNIYISYKSSYFAEDALEKSIVYMVILLLSFVSLSTLQNFVYRIESNKSFKAKKPKTISPLVSKEGAK